MTKAVPNARARSGFVARLFAAMLALAACCTTAFAQPYPAKPIRMVVVAPAGGISDIVARVVAEGLTPLLGRTVIVDNRPGALGAIGTQDLLSAPHDGYTFLVAPNGLASGVPHLTKLRFDPFKDIVPLAELSRTGLLLIGNPAVPAANVKDLVAWVKSQPPGKISYASYSAGSASHIMGLVFAKAAGLEMTHVGYKGAPPALQDVMGGHVPLMFDTPASSIPLLEAGKIKPFAITLGKRLAALPDVPTFAELGYPQVDEVAWIGLWTTPDVPAEARAKVRDATLQVLRQPRVAERFAALGLETGQPAPPEQLTQDLRKAYAEYGKQLEAIGFKPQ